MKMLDVPGSAGVSPNVVYFLRKKLLGPKDRPLIAAHHPKNGVVTSFSNSLQNKKFCELLLGRPGRQAGIGLNLQRAPKGRHSRSLMNPMFDNHSHNELCRAFGARFTPNSNPDLTVGPINASALRAWYVAYAAG
jgi:hypothetical protein